MGDWADHVEKHGGWYKCNIAANATGELAEKLNKAVVGKEEL
jgi:hypothetical protein